MRILNRYILGSMVKIFLGCILIFMMLYVIIDIFNHLDELLKQKINIQLLLVYYLNFLPLIFVQVSPFACLLGCLYTLGILNRNNEIIAMRTSGLSIFHITKDLIIFASIVAIFVFLINDRIVPKSEIIKQNIEIQMQKKEKDRDESEKYKEVIPNLSIYGLKNRLFFINKFIIRENTMEGITILEHDEYANLRKKIVASKGIYKEGLWHFYECMTYIFDNNAGLIDRPKYVPEQLMDIAESPDDFLKQRQKPEFMSVAQLNDYIWRLSKSKSKTLIRNLHVDLYQRFFMPLTCLVILIVGIPFSLMMRRRATGLSSLGIAIMVGFLYYVVNAISIAFGKAGILPALLSVSLSHILFLTLALYLIRESS